LSKNILLITADHMRHDAIACNADGAPSSALARVIRTPNLDRLAREGVTFRNSFTPNPICVPARATITTGNHPIKCTGVKDNGGRIYDDQAKLAEVFNGAGYATYSIGKLHYVPYSPPEEPRLLHGFQYCELYESGRIIAHFDPNCEMEGLEDYHDYLKAVGWSGYSRAHAVGNNDIHPVASPLPAEHHEEAWVASRSIAALERHRQEKPSQPFLIWASFAKPHSPYDPPRPYDAMYDPRHIPEPLGGWDNEDALKGRDPELIVRRRRYGWERYSPQGVQLSRAHYAGMVSFQDAQIGRIMEWLDGSGLADDTIVVYTSDHGDLLGDFGRFFKTCMYDGSVKVPFIWRAPGLVAGNDPHRRDQLVGLEDILPTLCGLTGVNLGRDVDGVDLTPTLRDATTPSRQFYVSETGDSCQKAMVRTADWKYLYCEVDGVEELYDAREPDGELRNLADNPAYVSVVSQLRETLIQWCKDNGDARLIPDGKLSVTQADTLPPAEFSVNILGWRRV